MLLATYLPFFLILGFKSAVWNTLLHESSALRKESEVASMMITSGVLPHALQENPAEKSMSRRLRYAYHDKRKWLYANVVFKGTSPRSACSFSRIEYSVNMVVLERNNGTVILVCNFV